MIFSWVPRSLDSTLLQLSPTWKHCLAKYDRVTWNPISVYVHYCEMFLSNNLNIDEIHKVTTHSPVTVKSPIQSWHKYLWNTDQVVF